MKMIMKNFAGYLALLGLLFTSCATEPDNKNAAVQSDTTPVAVQDTIASVGSNKANLRKTFLNQFNDYMLASPAGNAAIIEDEIALNMIKAYRSESNIPKTWYVDFNYKELTEFLKKQPDDIIINGNVVPLNELGIRIYPALSANGKLTTVVALTHKNHALWLDAHAQRHNVQNPELLKAFDLAGICPTNCGDTYDQNGVINENP